MILLLKGQLSLFHITLALTLFGTGVGMTASPTNHLIMKNTPKEFVGVISSLMALLRNIGILLGSTIGLAFITQNQSIPTSVTFIFAIGSCISLLCLLGIGLLLGKRIMPSPKISKVRDCSLTAKPSETVFHSLHRKPFCGSCHSHPQNRWLEQK